MIESAKAQEVGELAVSRNEINMHERENRERMAEMRVLREKRSGSLITPYTPHLAWLAARIWWGGAYRSRAARVGK